MLSGISWADYLTVIAVGLLLYYPIVAVRFYSREIMNLVRGKNPSLRQPLSSADEEEIPESVAASPYPWDDEETERAFVQAEELSENIRNTLREVSEKQLDRPSCLALLKTLTEQYGLFRDTPFRAAINNLINAELEKYGSAPLSAVELDGLWEEDA